MSDKAKDLKVLKIRESVYRIITDTPKDLNSLRAFSVKKKIVASGRKFDNAIEMLKASGRIYVKGGKVALNPREVKSATFVARGRGGYLLLDGESRQYAIDGKSAEGYRSNDRVNVAFSQTERGNVPFIVSKQSKGEDDYSYLIQPPKSVLGRVVKVSHDELVFIPNDKKNYTKNVVILNPKNTLSKYQDKICLMSIVDEETAGRRACGTITEIKGDAGNPIHEYDTIAESHGANMGWSGGQLKGEIDAIPTEVDLSRLPLTDEKNAKPNYTVDLRHLNFTTVDPATCKDMDDAIYSTFDENGNIVVYTAVANVTKYVRLNSEIGKRYIQGGFTTYAPNKAYNILPPELSTGICSLNPNVPRLAFVVKSVVDSNSGEVIASQFFDAVIESKQKFSYEKAQEICDENGVSLKTLKEKVASQPLSIDEQVILNSKVADILWKGFGKREMLRFETKNEYDIKFNEDFSDIEDISVQPHIPYHKVIEAFMLTANEASANFAKENNLPNIYRVHDKPNEDKVEQAFEFFDYLGISFEGDLSPRGLQRLIQSVANSSQEKMVNNFLVRMQSKAKYSITTRPDDVEYVKPQRFNKGHKNNSMKSLMDAEDKEMEGISHFGLQSRCYSHTTSPIRRITDYITHFNILAYLNGEKLMDEKTVLEISQWANQMQDENDLAEREFNEVNSAIYCENHVGDVMQGRVVGFKRPVDEIYSSSEEYMVLVENEDKGIKVQIPASELIEGVKNITMSTYGSAIISKASSRPLVRLCDEVNFKITEADRVSRIVRATANLENEDQKDDELKTTSGKQPEKALYAKRQKMLNNVAYNKEFANTPEAKEEMFVNRGKKHREAMMSKTGMEIDNKEAYQTNKNDGIKHKAKKREERFIQNAMPVEPENE